MIGTIINYYPYIIVFSVFNIFISLFYFVYGWIIYKKKAKKIQHSDLTPQQKIFLGTEKFKNVRYVWIKKFGKKIRNFSVLYFILSEILCFVAIWLTKKCVLICRISFFVAVFLLLFSLFLQLYYYRNKTAKLAEEHKKNLEKALERFDEIQSEDDSAEMSD